MLMYNTSLETFDHQCNSIVFKFFPRQATNVPDDLKDFVYESLKARGVFPLIPGKTPEEIKKDARNAMISYLKGTIEERITNFIAQMDEFKKKGVTVDEDPRLTRAKRWKKELIAVLEMEAPIEEELSFLDDATREGLGITEKKYSHVPEGLLSSAITEEKKIVNEASAAKDLENLVTESLKPKLGRPRKVIEATKEV